MGNSANCEIYRSISDVIRLNNEAMSAIRNALQLTLSENEDEGRVLNDSLLAYQKAGTELDRMKGKHEQNCSKCKK
jgi:Arc/MetJ-type ribon-helix-helix transcriptional regulator